jgi:eukaryotic-like serine/threonine-protein kinase
MPASPENWEAVKELFEAALEEDSAQRSEFLKERCPDAIVRAEVERLLAEHDQDSRFLSTPPLGRIPFEIDSRITAHRFSKDEVLAGRFRIVRFIDSGGMGEVYEAQDQELHEAVALKLIRPEIMAQPNALARFKREVHLARRVTHPNVCRVFDLFRHKPERGKVQQEIVFISMELLSGQTLAEQLELHGPLDVDVSLRLVLQMASALDAAHSVDVVHRDFKPGNVILIGTRGQWRPVVTDFGLALVSSASQSTVSFSTGEGLLGTPAYMSPEQLEGRPATRASDIYALGLVAYEMVTGVHPFKGEARTRLTQNPQPPRRFRPELAPVWDSVILRSLDRDPGKRFPTAKSIAEALTSEETRASLGSGNQERERKFWIAFPVLIFALLIIGTLYYRSRQSKHLSEKDTIVLADFANRTGDPDFDDDLKTALNISLKQSPFLNVLSDAKVAKTLQQMTRPAGTKLTPDVAQELCVRIGSKAYIAGSIGVLGNQYVLDLKAMNCETEETLAEEQVTVASKEKVLSMLGEVASKLRGELGESLATVKKFDVPLEVATTSSLDALKAYSIGKKTYRKQGPAGSLAHYARAIELDPNFAMAYKDLGDEYVALGQLARANSYYTKAFQLREHASEWERLQIAGTYYLFVTGEQDKAVQTYQEMVGNFPRDVAAYNNLGLIYGQRGQYAKAVEISRPAISLDPDDVNSYVNLATYYLALQRFSDARQLIRNAQVRRLDDEEFHIFLYALAFVDRNLTAMAEQQQWFASESQPVGLSLASDTEAYGGHLAKSQELSKRAVDLAVQTDSKEDGAIFQANAAILQAAFGNLTQARQLAAAASNLASGPSVKAEVALAFAMAGDNVRANSLTKYFPLDTQMQSLWLPAIQGQLALNKKNPTAALTVLQAAAPVELGQIEFLANISCLYPTYIRGEAYLAANQGRAAASEFNKILDHTGIVWNCWTGALAHLGVARANALQARFSQGADADVARDWALSNYKDFLKLWKDADSDIPILKQAKAEYARLQ